MKVGVDSLESNTKAILSHIIGKHITGVKLSGSSEPSRYSDKLMLQVASAKRKSQVIKQDKENLFDDRSIFLEVCFEKFGCDIEGNSIIATNLSVSSYFFNGSYGVEDTVVGFEHKISSNLRIAVLGYQIQEIFIYEGFTPKIMISFDTSGSMNRN